ncbi:MAG: GIY-YIG nuclease family protein, partial [Aliidongia sp.]
ELLSTGADDIFEMKHARPASVARPDKVSERKPCPDFERFKTRFDACAADLASSIRKSMPFANEQEIRAGDFFILNGITVFVAEVNDPHIRNGKKNARLRLIFENGTEGENLLRSLATELYKDPAGRRISDPSSGPLFGSEPTTETVAAPEDRVTGFIYVVRSLSAEPDIKKLDGHLYKIGVTTGTVDARISSAADDPTFLLAPVHPVRTFDLVNLNAVKVENLLHRFFTDVRLDIEIIDRFGKPFRPREWFLLSLPVIEQAIHMLLDGSILRYRYDARTGEIIEAG